MNTTSRKSLDLYVVSRSHFVNLKESTKVSNATSAIGLAKATNMFAFHVYSLPPSPGKPDGGLRYEKLYPRPISHFAETLTQAINQSTLSVGKAA